MTESEPWTSPLPPDTVEVVLKLLEGALIGPQEPAAREANLSACAAREHRRAAGQLITTGDRPNHFAISPSPLLLVLRVNDDERRGKL